MAARKPPTSAPAPTDTLRPPTPVGKPGFSNPQRTADPTKFVVKHPSDGPFYDEITAFNKAHGKHARPFPEPRGGTGAELTLDQVLGGNPNAIAWIEQNQQIVFHSTGDCGSIVGPTTQNLVVDKMLADFSEGRDREVPQFHLLLGDVV
jgi:hypothetical protein